jgi:hypothetical protein
MVSQPKRIAERASWKRVDMPTKTAALKLKKNYDLEEFRKIANGCVPEIMEDKWFIFMEERTLYLHRSWTGFCVFQVTFEETEDKYEIVEVLCNRDPEQSNNMSDNDCIQMLLRVIENVLLLDKV